MKSYEQITKEKFEAFVKDIGTDALFSEFADFVSKAKFTEVQWDTAERHKFPQLHDYMLEFDLRQNIQSAIEQYIKYIIDK